MKTKLLSAGNPKTLKGQKQGYMTFILHLAPATVSGYNTCAKATDGCIASCLNLAGRGGMFAAGESTNVVQRARIRKTRLFFENRTEFMAMLVDDIENAILYAQKRGYIPVFRLNGTSDIAWEKYTVQARGEEFVNIFAAFPGIQFYDYTAIIRRKIADYPNYHLTFSAKESNAADVRWAIKAGMNVATVFDLPKKAPMPEVFDGLPVFNADESDLRFLDPKGVICGLYIKGKHALRQMARDSGFARRVIQISAA
jgi:hypothetical protein